ncbi:2-keto-4-pentenoate hydratase [Agrobacterium sp. NPDC089420]|uniref:2-keto-4-pentenoate hydratase n=1 Tax=Agrobacterium sp. NPDC089420 TaxID=3363918 RepID=UPI00384C9EA5
MTVIEELAQRYLGADRAGVKIPLAELEAGGLVPDGFETAMAVQRAFAGLAGKAVKGWKLAIRPNGEAVGALMLDCHWAGEDDVAVFPNSGTEGIEVEICFTLAADIPAAGAVALSRVDLIRHIDKVHLGAELLRYRLVEKNQVPFPLFLADRLANHGFAIGPEVDRGILDVFAGNEAGLPHLTVTEGSVELFDATARHPNGDILAPLVAFANAPINKGGLLKAGQVVTTGSLCGVIPGTLATDIHIQMKAVAAFTLAEHRPGTLR